MLKTLPHLFRRGFPPLLREGGETLQVNLGYRCNQQCLHCHVAASPARSEVMASEVVDEVIALLARGIFTTLDLTGGAPEMNPDFRRLVTAAVGLGVAVIDRCNLTILQSDGQEDLAEFLATWRVGIVASLPCYLEQNVDKQRGSGSFAASIAALRTLNGLGYGKAGSGLQLDLVYNPTGATLPPPQQGLEADYRRILGERYAITFNRLLALANLPVQRFGSTLLADGEFDAYMDLLQQAHQEANLQHVMCRRLVNVDWQGWLYDCDFNQMLGLPLTGRAGERLHLRDLVAGKLRGLPIAVADHCYGCTAGQGSSCGGALQ
jgi:radical SAM/Cys-rich protein